MDQKTKLTIIGGAALLIIAIVFVTIFYFGRASRTTTGPGDSGTNPLDQLPTTAAPSVSPLPGVTGGSAQGKMLVGKGFSLTYPNNWGVLTCSNSQNFEFDPTSNADVRNVKCDTAVKPVTVIVTNQLSCTGDTVNFGNNKVTKSKAATATGTNYRWCVAVGNIGLDITHRVSSAGTQATSKDDFSAQVEQIITTVKPSAQGS